jgi:hypothetical protein
VKGRLPNGSEREVSLPIELKNLKGVTSYRYFTHVCIFIIDCLTQRNIIALVIEEEE